MKAFSRMDLSILRAICVVAVGLTLYAGPGKAEGGAALPDPVFLSHCREVVLSGPGSAPITRLAAEYARDAGSRAHGMMGRLSHPEGAAMLFDFADGKKARFWMKNTPAPLDIAFFDRGGTLIHLARGEPFSEELIQVPDDRHATHVLEIPAGDAGKYRLSIGESRIRIGPVHKCPRGSPQM